MHKGNNCETSFKLKEVSDKTQTLGANTPPYCENSTKNKKIIELICPLNEQTPYGW
jgi:hypothetical protein